MKVAALLLAAGAVAYASPYVLLWWAEKGLAEDAWGDFAMDIYS